MTREDKQKEMFNSILSNEGVKKSFNDTYGDNGDKKLKRELSYFRNYILSLSDYDFNKAYRSTELERCFAKLGSVKNATLSPVLKHFQLYPSFGNKWVFDVGYRLFLMLYNKRPDVQSVKCFVVCENDNYDLSGSMHGNITYTPAPRNRGAMILTVLTTTFTNGIREVDVLPIEFYEQRAKLNKAKNSPHQSFPETMAIKTHVKHQLSKFGGIEEYLIELDSLLEDEFTATKEDIQDKAEPITIEAIEKAEKIDLVVEKVIDTFDMEEVPQEETKPTKKEETKSNLMSFEDIKDNLVTISTIEKYEDYKKTITDSFRALPKEQQSIIAKLMNDKHDLITKPQPISPDEL